ncbi:MAG: 4-hydroxybenzoate octaprenyltransferase [Gammaproteobacteria bacterium]|jgi:4-hydroxybenzoate polyprenyltransferase|nr:4-hydroxybenzoate octaprenyltransferase [Gammaproteobacteria bacterium]MBT7225314.1 4-hydroxybenzoate octaprenyltransferase [Gammaproteobacteria bacterium]MDB3908486.1 4-hydroxybenzoate octaprenyltransferase [Gammaproteobacteria bacterium]MDC0414422.1 4-hydroxybenzoate octaprenyltransferase [Gammaproteobacteria bacterium]
MDSVRKIRARVIARFRSQFPELYSKLPAFVELTRANKPIGIYLLLWPTICALWIAEEGFPRFSLLVIFVLGTALMRSAGCCVNDFADHKIDGKVLRTEGRPLATGTLTRKDAFLCFAVLCLISFGLVLLTNERTIILSFAAVALAAVYPFMKRFTNLPQLVLGIAFSWGILMAFSAATGDVPQPAYLLFVANCLWIVAYDTQYAMVDREFDIEIGVKSTAILFGDADKVIIGSLQAMFIFAMILAGRQFELGSLYYISLLIASGLLAYQQYLIRDRLPGPCFEAFLNNNWVGAVIFVGVMLSYI